MTNKQMQQLINKTAKAARKEYKKYNPAENKIIDINYGLPYVSVNSGNDEYFFQGEEAGNLLDEATTASNKFQTSVEDTIIWMSQGW